jgi:hypothetical protein
MTPATKQPRTGERKRTAQERKRAEQELVAATADQQKIRTGIFPAPEFLRRFAKAR